MGVGRLLRVDVLGDEIKGEVPLAIIALHDSDGTAYPNLVLMKLAAWHKAKGDTVERFMPILHSARGTERLHRVFQQGFFMDSGRRIFAAGRNQGRHGLRSFRHFAG